jgi:hypothetical protein
MNYSSVDCYLSRCSYNISSDAIHSRTFNPTLQRTNAENSKQIFPERELYGHCPKFHIHVSVSDLYIPMIDLPILLQEICGPILGKYESLTGT